MNIGKVGCFPAQRGPIVDDLELNLFAGVIDDWHGSKQNQSGFPALAHSDEFLYHRLDLFANARFERPAVVENDETKLPSYEGAHLLQTVTQRDRFKRTGLQLFQS